MNLSNLLQDAYRILGRTKTFVATGGSATTAICTNLKEEFTDDDMADWSLFVSSTTDGLTPQGKFALISSYAETENTITVPTLTDAIGAGDVITLADSQFPLQEMISLANLALQSLGNIPVTPDTSITTEAGHTEYTLPKSLKYNNLWKVQYQLYTDDSSDNGWVTLNPSEYEVVPSNADSDATLILRDELDSGHTIKVWYIGTHPTLSIYSSVISEYVHPVLAANALVLQAVNWFNSKVAGSNDFWTQKQNYAQREYEIALQRYPFAVPRRLNKSLVIGE
jgi:hypothetical protein